MNNRWIISDKYFNPYTVIVIYIPVCYSRMSHLTDNTSFNNIKNIALLLVPKETSYFRDITSIEILIYIIKTFQIYVDFYMC